ncbi:Thaumatin-like protein 1, partial [Ananas comosus]
GEGTTFTFVNRCGGTVWPGCCRTRAARSWRARVRAGVRSVADVRGADGWSGRFWARTGCNFDASDRGSCATGDCGSGQLQCNGAGAAPPATLAEFTLSSSASSSSAAQDFYDVSLVGRRYNLPMTIEANAGRRRRRGCAATGCAADLNKRCRRAQGGEGKGRRAGALARPLRSRSSAAAGPSPAPPPAPLRLLPDVQVRLPQSYSYAFDDPTSTFTCSGGAGYTITFCPASSPP